VVAGQHAVGDAVLVQDLEHRVDVLERRGGAVLGEVTEVGQEIDVVAGGVAALLDDPAERGLLRGRADAALLAPVQELGVGHHGQRELEAVRVRAPPATGHRPRPAAGSAVAAAAVPAPTVPSAAAPAPASPAVRRNPRRFGPR
jgi:hypothetical protein